MAGCSSCGGGGIAARFPLTSGDLAREVSEVPENEAQVKLLVPSETGVVERFYASYMDGRIAQSRAPEGTRLRWVRR